ncbi:hypothetical protein P389DRAFT_197215 [Cystobasidium minutum MCA 4210]|uniref:uncharacterized protein n=1 Tax=Cystobasidium minutum MCA 4210 TaxID=1397322 RepID=UPI0034CD835E|eukprot:jgi/Rhomi1/197215/gm1.5429_g
MADGGGDGGGAGSGYEWGYASQAVYSKHIAAMTREERQKIIQDYQNAVTPSDRAGLLSASSSDDKASIMSGANSGAGDPNWSTTNGNMIASAQKNINKIDGLFKRKSSQSTSKDQSGVQANSMPTLERVTSGGSTDGFQKLDDK